MSRTVGSLCVLAAGASYGLMGPLSKAAFGAGFTWQGMTAAQGCFGALLFGAVFAIQLIIGKRPVGVSGKTAGLLVLTGFSTGMTCVLNNVALSFLPVASAITLFFQFAWMGTVLQVIVTRQAPSASQVAGVLVILAGSLGASGIVGSEVAWNVPGVAAGLGAAVCFTVFLFLSGRVAPDMPTVQKGLTVSVGFALLSVITCPQFFPSGLALEITPFGVPQGFFSMFLPVLLLAAGTPKVTAGMATILASAELPVSVAISFAFVGESVGIAQWTGVAVVVFGIAVSQLKVGRRQGGVRP